MLKLTIFQDRVRLNPRDPDFYNDPYKYYAYLRQHTPIFYWEDFGLYCFLNHEDIHILLREKRLGRQITHLHSREALGWAPERQDLRAFIEVDRHSLLELEPPAHTRLRALIHKAFVAKNIEYMRPAMTERCEKLLDQLAEAIARDGKADLKELYATPLPVWTIADMLKVPLEKSPKLLDWSHAMVAMYELGRTPEQERLAVQAAEEFTAYVKALIAERRLAPGDDLISMLVQVEVEGEHLTEDEVISTVILALNAGHEATVNVIANGVYALLKNPTQWQALQVDVNLVRPAVEELLRFDTPLHLFTRYVLEDFEYKGISLKVGQQIAVLLGAGNHDPARFDQPACLDLSRNPNPHDSFGGGIHYCVGAPLARLELAVAIPLLLKRFPNLQLAEEPVWRNSWHFRGVEALWVTNPH
jgi:unspecific monooxygenase